MKITVGFSRAKSPWKIGSKIIQLVERRNFSHAYITFEDQITKELLVCQASHGYVNMVNSDIFLLENVVCESYDYELTSNEFQKILTFVDSKLGIEYSKLQLILIGVKKLFHFEPDIRNGDKEYICSEFAAKVCEVLGLIKALDQDYITPSDFNKLIKDSYGKNKPDQA